MTLTVGAATDHLVTAAQTAVTGITVGGHPVIVVDGWPSELAMGMFVVGLNTAPPEDAGQTLIDRGESPAGAQFVEEDYRIPCYIDVRVPGTTAQKTARDLAEQVFNAFWQQLATDLTLGKLLPFPVELDGIVYVPSNVGTPAEPGRRQFIGFNVHCRSGPRN